MIRGYFCSVCAIFLTEQDHNKLGRCNNCEEGIQHKCVIQTIGYSPSNQEKVVAIKISTILGEAFEQVEKVFDEHRIDTSPDDDEKYPTQFTEQCVGVLNLLEDLYVEFDPNIPYKDKPRGV